MRTTKAKVKADWTSIPGGAEAHHLTPKTWVTFRMTGPRSGYWGRGYLLSYEPATRMAVRLHWQRPNGDRVIESFELKDFEYIRPTQQVGFTLHA